MKCLLEHNEWKEQGSAECVSKKTKISIHKGEANCGWGSREDFLLWYTPLYLLKFLQNMSILPVQKINQGSHFKNKHMLWNDSEKGKINYLRQLNVWYATICNILFPALLRYDWHITLCNFKMSNLLVWYTYILQNDYHQSTS